MKDRACVEFLQWALPRLGMRWPGFRKVRRQVCRRLARRLQTLGLSDLGAYRKRLERSSEEWGVLDGMCRITISRFYRDRAVFDLLRERIFPEVVQDVSQRGGRVLRVWSAGCASGEEPYSVSLCWMLDAKRGASDIELAVTATDNDPHLLKRAREACYPSGTLKDLPSEWMAEAFSEREGELCLRAAYRSAVRFLRQDLREKMPSGSFELILCRNLAFTYFDPELQGTVLRRLLRRLTDGGFLIVGGHESPPTHEDLSRPFGARPVYRRLTPL